MVIDTWPRWRFEIWFLEAKMVNLCPVDFQLSSISLYFSFLFLTHFCSEASKGQYCAHGPKTTLKLLVHVQATNPNPQIDIVFSKLKGLDPLECSAKYRLGARLSCNKSLIRRFQEHLQTFIRRILIIRTYVYFLMVNNREYQLKSTREMNNLQEQLQLRLHCQLQY